MDHVCGVLDMGMVDMGREVEEGEGGGVERESDRARATERKRKPILLF